ncbi:MULTISPECIES: helix-turn-helix domain-containing protein [Prochlorococcus]|uniref:helix-turn-helix domain-containing protein n=1 Tax=Prochlorococcus TaxID=1218 RepID=UPI00053396C3|nr:MULTISPECIES: helix-turn-helix domain-containing protein [Prochlorococcus]KGG14131.1 hypothetical protein EV05_0020 [Prochlorococcus sp. MIT 0601]
MKEVGLLMSQARKNKSISISSLSKSLRIAKEYIIALENARFDLLTEDVFIKGMIRRISEKLSIDSTVIINKINIEAIASNNKDIAKPNKTWLSKYFGIFSKSKSQSQEPNQGVLLTEKTRKVELDFQKEVKRIADEQRLFEEKCIAEEKPVLEEKPIAEEKPVLEEKPIAEEKPVLEEKPIAEEKRLAEEERLLKKVKSSSQETVLIVKNGRITEKIFIQPNGKRFRVNG